jgi:molecular chaperone GrpE
VTKKSDKSRASKKRAVSEVAPDERVTAAEEGRGAQEKVPTVEEQGQPKADVAWKSDDGQPQEAAELVEISGAELEQLLSEKEEYYDRLLRLTAEFENYKKRTRREFDDFRRYAAENVIQRLLPILDNFERALLSAPEGADDGFRAGIEIIHKQLRETLAKAGLSPMEPVGRKFDPNLHEALMPVQSDEHEEGIVVEEFQQGYTLLDKVIRHAKVSVSAGKAGVEDRDQAADVTEDEQAD